MVINGQKIEGVGRSPKDILEVICSAFKTQPKECKEKLSSETYKSGFGYDAQAAGAPSASCGS